jgi:hypothetical protein
MLVLITELIRKRIDKVAETDGSILREDDYNVLDAIGTVFVSLLKSIKKLVTQTY